MDKRALAIVVVITLLTTMFLVAIQIISAGVLEVGPGKTYSTIQAAIDASGSGDTIMVYPGTYEPFNVSGKVDLTVVANVTHTVVVNGSQSVTTSYGDRYVVILVHNSINITLEGLDIEGHDLPLEPKDYGVIYDNSSGMIRDCIVSPNTIGDMIGGVAIAAWEGSALTVNSCTVQNYGRIGVFYYNNCTGGVYDSTIIGQVYSGQDEVCYGIEVHGVAGDPDPNTASQITIKGNEIYDHDNTYSPEPSWGSSAIYINGWLAYYDEADSTVAVELNQIHDNYNAIYVVKSPTSYAHYNNIEDNRDDGIYSAADYNNINATFDAECNYWGDASGPTHSSNPGGVGEIISDYVDYSPWLGDPFEITPRTYHVNPTGTIQEAIDEASSGDTIIVAAGTYSEDLTVPKGLALTAESGAKIVGGIWIKDIHNFVDPITVENFIIENGTSIDATHDYGIKISGDIGAGADQAIVDMHIVNNTFINCGKTDDVTAEVWWNAAVFFDANHFGALGSRYDTIFMGTGEISNNTIVNNLGDPTKRTQLGIGVRSGRNMKINYNTISGNVAEGIHHWGPVNTASIGNYEIDHNYIDLTGWIGDRIGNNPRGIWSYAPQSSISYNTLISKWIGMVLTYWDDTYWGGSSAGGNLALIVSHNLIHPPAGGNMSVGLRISGSDSQITDNEIYGATDNVTGYGAGLLFEGWGHPEWGERTECSNNTFTGNYIHDNCDGIWTWGPPYNNTFDNEFHYNKIENNINSGMTNNNNGTIVDARLNWWGHSSGPSGAGLGTGDSVSENVNFEPWLSCYVPQVETKIYIDPPTVEEYARVGIECKEFEVDVRIANVTDLWGFDIELTYNSTLLNLTNVEYESQLNMVWGEGLWSVVKNNVSTGWFKFTVLALNPATGFSGDAALIRLTFHVEYGPCYIEPNYQVQTRLHFALVKLSDSGADPICTQVQDGTCIIHAVRPWLRMYYKRTLSANITCRKLGETFTLRIKLVDAFKVSGFEVEIHYNTTLINQMSIVWGDLSGFLPGPYIIKEYTVDDVNGLIRFRLSENVTAGAPLAYGDAVLAEITFNVTGVKIWKKIDCTGWENYLHDLIEFTYWNITVRCPDVHFLTGDLVYISNADYWYVPIQGDINSDGDVGMLDLRTVAYYYEVEQGDPDWSEASKYDLNCDGIIDLYDLVSISTNFGYEYDG